jgi:hypothetical protein
VMIICMITIRISLNKDWTMSREVHKKKFNFILEIERNLI